MSSTIFVLWCSYMLEYHWLFTLFLRLARRFTGAEGKWTPLPPISLPSSSNPKNLFSIFLKFSIQSLWPESQLFKNCLVLGIFLTSASRKLSLYTIQFNKFISTPHCVGDLVPMPHAFSECCPRICILSASHRAGWHCRCWNHFGAYLKAYHKVRRERWGEFWGFRISKLKILDSTQVHFVPGLLLIARTYSKNILPRLWRTTRRSGLVCPQRHQAFDSPPKLADSLTPEELMLSVAMQWNGMRKPNVGWESSVWLNCLLLREGVRGKDRMWLTSVS